MKKILLILLLVILVNSMSGCTLTKENVQPVIVQYKYKNRTIPRIQSKPVPNEYKVLEVEAKGKKYFVYKEQDAKIMASNWTSYKVWAEHNYNILLKLK